MNAKNLIASLFVATLATGAIAQDARTAHINQVMAKASGATAPRAQVQSEVAQARIDGTLEAYNGEGKTMPSLKSTRSRSEVLAEVHIWRQSGLAELDLQGEGRPDPSSPRYQAAQARYDALRAAPEFAVLVQRIAQERGEKSSVAAQ